MIGPKYRTYPVAGGIIYKFRGETPLFVPERQGLNEDEARELNTQLGKALGDLEILRAAVKELSKLHINMARVSFEINAMQPMDQDFRVQGLLETLGRSGYIKVSQDKGYLNTQVCQPAVITEILEEL